MNIKLKNRKNFIFTHLVGTSPGAGQGPGRKFESDQKGRGKQNKSDVPGVAGGGMGSEQFDRRIMIISMTMSKSIN